MRVLLVGVFRYGHLAASYRKAFESLGHEVISFDIDRNRQWLVWWLQQRISHRLTIRSLLARRLGSVEYNRQLLEVVAQGHPDLVFALNSDFIMPETIRYIRNGGIRFAIFHADNPFPPHYNHRPETLENARECDVYFVWSYALVERLRQSGIQAEFLAFGWDANLFPFQGFPSQQPNDVTFIGGWDPQREAFLEHVAKHFNLKIWGPDYWRTRTRPSGLVRQCWQGGELIGENAAVVLSRSKINLNILRKQHYTSGVADGVIMRTFEVPGAGGFLLATRSGSAVDLFPEDESSSYFSSVDECLSRIDYYLGSDEQRCRIAKYAHAQVDANHQYWHRVQDFLAFLK